MMQCVTKLGLANLAVAVLVAATALTARADLQHRYSFTSDISDSVGTADGMVVDPTGNIANFADGRLDMSAIDGENSNQDPFAAGGYVDLPNGTVSALGDTASIELWLNVETNRTWAQAFAFGSSNAGEDIATGGDGSQYINLIPQSAPNRLESHITEVGVGGGNPIRPGGPLATGVDHHLVAVVDGSDTMDGLNPDGTAYLYLNGAEVARAALYPDFALSELPDVNNWLGRSQWPDPLFDGMYDELRFYDHALSGGDAALNNVLGPDELPPDGAVFTLEVNTVDGSAKVVSNVAGDIPFNYYEITSAGGALDTSGWNSLDDQESGDPPGQGWDESGQANSNQLIELFLAEAGDSLAGGGELNLGSAFDPDVFGAGQDGDLAFQFGITGASEQSIGDVIYITESTPVTGDYNNDGIVNAADYVVWRNNEGTTNALPNDEIGGTIGQQHYEQWTSNFGNSGGAGSLQDAAAAVPEPASLLILLAGATMPVFTTRRRRLTGPPA